MNLIVSLWRGKRNVITASVTDGEAVADLKEMAQEKGYTVQIVQDGERVDRAQRALEEARKK